MEAGLGEKKVVVPDVDSCSPREFQHILVTAFAKLDGCGGFDLLRCVPNSKNLEVIFATVSQSAKLLKSVVGTGKVFIRPIQQDLKLEVDEELVVASEVLQQLVFLTIQETIVYHKLFFF